VALGHPCTSITTTGLKWNLNEAHLELGKLTSTSNKIAYSQSAGADHVIVVKNSHPVLWTSSLTLDFTSSNQHVTLADECS
jgi:hypothetical protein